MKKNLKTNRIQMLLTEEQYKIIDQQRDKTYFPSLSSWIVFALLKYLESQKGKIK